jgi:hypothetical protein
MIYSVTRGMTDQDLCEREFKKEKNVFTGTKNFRNIDEKYPTRQC